MPSDHVLLSVWRCRAADSAPALPACGHPWCHVADAAKPVAAMAGLPDIDDDNLDGENAFDFWSSVIT